MIFKELRENRGTVFLLILTTFPLIPWLLMQPLSVRFVDSLTALTSVSQVSALLGTVLFALVTLLFVSPHIASYLYSDQGLLLQARRFGGVVALLLLLIHPAVLTIKFIPHATTDALWFLLPGGDWAFNFGVYALILLLALYGIQFLSKKTDKLRHTPLVMGVVLFLGTLHAFFVPSDLSQNIVLKTYVLCIVGVTLSACIHRVLFINRLVGRLRMSQKTIVLRK